MEKDKKSQEAAEEATQRVFQGASSVPDQDNVPTGEPDNTQSGDHANTVDRDPDSKSAGEHQEASESSGMDQMINLLMDTPINPRPDSKPPLTNQKAFYLSAETEEMLDAAVTVMEQEMGQDRKKEVSGSLIAEIGLRAILFDFVDNREDSHLMEWFEDTFGPVERK
jgi:hypothetical protein